MSRYHFPSKIANFVRFCILSFQITANWPFKQPFWNSTLFLFRLWRNILADKPRVTKFPIEWDQVKDEADVGGEQQLAGGEQQQQEGGQFGVVPSSGMEGATPVNAGGDTDMQMD